MTKLWIAFAMLLSPPPVAAAVAQDSGPSATLFGSPYYSCLRNYYVAMTGSDSNGGTTSGNPWKTLQHANNSLPTGGAAAGTCINVAPGTYSAGVGITAGGNLAASTGYLVYRCTTMDACIITASNAAFFWYAPAQPADGSYVIIDGFKMSAA